MILVLSERMMMRQSVAMTIQLSKLFNILEDVVSIIYGKQKTTDNRLKGEMRTTENCQHSESRQDPGGIFADLYH